MALNVLRKHSFCSSDTNTRVCLLWSLFIWFYPQCSFKELKSQNTSNFSVCLLMEHGVITKVRLQYWLALCEFQILIWNNLQWVILSCFNVTFNPLMCTPIDLGRYYFPYYQYSIIWCFIWCTFLWPSMTSFMKYYFLLICRQCWVFTSSSFWTSTQAKATHYAYIGRDKQGILTSFFVWGTL